MLCRLFNMLASFWLQTTAYNDATFRQPDVDGWGPKHQCISKVLPHAAELMTTLPTHLLTGAPRVCSSVTAVNTTSHCRLLGIDRCPIEVLDRIILM